MPSARNASRISAVDEVRESGAPGGRSPSLTALDESHSRWLAAALALPGTSRFVEVDGARIHYLVWGEDRADKPVLVLVHGMRAHAHWWDAIAPSFAGRYRVIAPDLSGMGDSDRRETYVDPTYARDLIGVVAQECVSPVTVIGHSYGGSRVIQACAMRPELFSRLVLVDTFIAFEGEPLPVDPNRTTHAVYPELARAISRFRLLPEQPGIDAGYLEHLARHSLREVAGGYSWKFDPKLPTVSEREGNVSQRMGEVTVRVDYLCGEHSRIVDLARAQRIVHSFREGLGPVVIPNAHHHLMLDQPIALVSALRALLAGAP
jgi:pimeloyl-ACP methyl ester carboxylesterase